MREMHLLATASLEDGVGPLEPPSRRALGWLVITPRTAGRLGGLCLGLARWGGCCLVRAWVRVGGRCWGHMLCVSCVRCSVFGVRCSVSGEGLVLGVGVGVRVRVG